jgi:hypothetical protein
LIEVEEVEDVAGDEDAEQGDYTPQTDNSCPGTQDGTTLDGGLREGDGDDSPEDVNTLPSAYAYLPKTVPSHDSLPTSS